MKSAYELAMERLQKEDPTSSKPLTDEQKQQLAQIEKTYEAKIADRVIFLEKTLNDAQRAQDFAQADQISKQIHSERAVLRESCEREKDALRSTFK